METKTTKIMKVIITAVLVCGLCFALLYGACNSELTAEDQQAIKNLETILIQKHQKQDCLNGLTYLESIENARWILHCNENDEEIIKKRQALFSHISGEEYENIDLKIAEKVTDWTWTAMEKLTFLLSE